MLLHPVAIRAAIGMSRKKTDATKRTVKDTARVPDPNAEPDSPILRYLQSIDAKLDRTMDQRNRGRVAHHLPGGAEEIRGDDPAHHLHEALGRSA